jgi:hypothetical protein
MIKLILAFVIVVAVALSALMVLRRYDLLGRASPAAIDRAKVRERELEAKERANGDD